MIRARLWHAFVVASVLTFATSGWQLADAPRPVRREPGPLPWVELKPGAFQMGCVPDDRSCSSNEVPRHEVTITRAFSMTATPITVAQYRAYAAATSVRMPRQPEWSGDSHPVVETTWAEADAYCRWASGRLPTEAEWEYAARGGQAGTLYPWGNDFGKARVNTGGYDGGDSTQTVPVGTFEPNGFGLSDMVGNVWQWVADWYDERYYAASPASDPRGPRDGRFRVARGASWKPYPKLLRISNRGRFAPTHHNYYLGFRCAGEVIGRLGGRVSALGVAPMEMHAGLRTRLSRLIAPAVGAAHQRTRRELTLLDLGGSPP